MSDNLPTPNASTADPSAEEMKRYVANFEARKAAEAAAHQREQEEKRQAVIAEFHKPPEQTSDQLMQTVTQLTTHAAERGESEVQFYQFPSGACSDGGRRIDNALPDWQASLEGRPKFVYEFWHDRLRPQGFHLRAEVLNYPGGMPGDVGFFLSWKDD